MVREVGRVAAEKFPKQYKNIREWFQKYDQPNYSIFVFIIP